MGFLSDLGKAIIGPPRSNGSEQSQPTPAASDGIRDERGIKVFPDIDVHAIRSKRQGSKLERLVVRAKVKNEAKQPIRVDSTILLGQRRGQNQAIRPGESRELLFYEGPVPHDEHNDDAEVDFRLQVNEDVFRNRFRVEFHREVDGGHIVTELRDDGPIQDI